MIEYSHEVQIMSKREELKARVAELAHVESLNEETPLRELGLDSLDIVETLLELEDKYGISFDDIDMSKLQTVKDLLDCIEARIK